MKQSLFILLLLCTALTVAAQRKKDTVLSGFPPPPRPIEGRRDGPMTEEQKKERDWVMDKLKELRGYSQAMKACPDKGPAAEECRKKYKDLIREAEEDIRKHNAELMAKYGYTEEYRNKQPGDMKAADDPLFKQLKTTDAYKKDPGYKAALDRLIGQRQGLLDLEQKLLDCPEGKEGQACKTRYRNEIKDLKETMRREMEELLKKKGVTARNGAR